MMRDPTECIGQVVIHLGPLNDKGIQNIWLEVLGLVPVQTAPEILALLIIALSEAQGKEDIDVVQEAYEWLEKNGEKISKSLKPVYGLSAETRH